MKAAVQEAKTKHGLTITGIVHAAGVLRDKMVENKTVDDFDSVFGVKITGLTNIFNAFSASERAGLRHLVVFSSLAGFHGNAGQTDYAMANDALSKMSTPWPAHPSCSPRLCFGPWDGGIDAAQGLQSQGVRSPRPGHEQVAAVLMQGKGATMPLRQGLRRDAGRRRALGVEDAPPRRRRRARVAPDPGQGRRADDGRHRDDGVGRRQGAGFFLDSVKDASSSAASR